jgi:hypothetical protein
MKSFRAKEYFFAIAPRSLPTNSIGVDRLRRAGSRMIDAR